jgi:hypothetical protein
MAPMSLPTMVFCGVGALFFSLVALRPMPIFRLLSYGRRFRPGEPVPRSIKVIQVIAAVSVVSMALRFVVEFVSAPSNNCTRFRSPHRPRVFALSYADICDNATSECVTHAKAPLNFSSISAVGTLPRPGINCARWN